MVPPSRPPGKQSSDFWAYQLFSQSLSPNFPNHFSDAKPCIGQIQLFLGKNSATINHSPWGGGDGGGGGGGEIVCVCVSKYAYRGALSLKTDLLRRQEEGESTSNKTKMSLLSVSLHPQQKSQ